MHIRYILHQNHYAIELFNIMAFFVRYTQPPADLFGWFQPYLEDEEVSISGFKSALKCV